MFCEECGAKNLDSSKFCAECGKPLVQIPAAAEPHPVAGHEQILGIFPFVEQGTIFIDRFTLIITRQRLIFAKVPPRMTASLETKTEEIDDGTVDYEDLAAQRTYLNIRNWSDGPWREYASMNPDMIATESKGNISIPVATIENANVIIDTEIDYLDELQIVTTDAEKSFDLNYASGDRIAPVLTSILGARFQQNTRTEWETLHKK
jgi:hypothetical protein